MTGLLLGGIFLMILIGWAAMIVMLSPHKLVERDPLDSEPEK